MSLRLNGSVLGKRNVPTATLATGAWNLRAQSLYRRDNIWPRRDPDAVAFAATSGATDIDAISDFVKGVKRLGLWSNMVCWPLRSTQNAGTGTTAYSLGGLGTFNGTLVNGPTWGSDGVAFANASLQYVSLGASQILAVNSNYSAFAAAKLTNIAAPNLTPLSLGNGRAVIGVASNGSTQIRNVQWQNDNTSGGGQLFGGPTTSFFSSFITGDAVSAKNYNNGTLHNTLTADFRLSPTITSLEEIGANNISVTGRNIHWNGDIAVGAIWNVKLIDAQVASIYNLYKQTLGTGLGLP